MDPLLFQKNHLNRRRKVLRRKSVKYYQINICNTITFILFCFYFVWMQKEICYKCECVSKEGMDLHKQLIEEKHKKEMEEEKKSMKLPQKRSPDSKSKKSVHPSPIVLKDNKLQPSIDFR